MGGAAGHCPHLYENTELTFAELKDVLTKASEGKLERVSEKLDGINIVFSYDPDTNLMKVARSGNDIKLGGATVDVMLQKFHDKKHVREAFHCGLKVLNESISTLSAAEQLRVFGTRYRKWYSLEIIYSALPNTINYDKEHIVFHGWPIYERSGKNISSINDEGAIELLRRNIQSMQKAVTATSWVVQGPALLVLKAISDGSVLNNAVDNIDSAMASAGVDDSSTLGDYIYSCALDDVKQRFGFLDHVCQAVAGRLAGRGPTLIKIKKMSASDQYALIRTYVSNERELRRAWLRPIEDAIYALSVEVLRGVHSTLIADGDAEVQRLRKVLANAIREIQARGGDEALSTLERHMDRLKEINNVSSSMEGIIFTYKGRSYKFTGAFAPAHQIISLIRYGQPLRNEHTGNAVPNVSSITLEELKPTMHMLIEDLHDVGVKNIEPIGSTGKADVMSDVDLTGTFDEGRDVLYGYLVDMFGRENVRRYAAETITFAYPIKCEGMEKKHVQVDLMLGEPTFIKWARYAPLANESMVKGVIRNMLFNTAFRITSENVHGMNRTRIAIDFERGLYRINQTLQGKTTVLKEWKTLERRFLTSEPSQIVCTLLGKDYHDEECVTFECLVKALYESNVTCHLAPRIMKAFVEEIELLPLDSKALGSEPIETIQYIRNVANRCLCIE